MRKNESFGKAFIIVTYAYSIVIIDFITLLSTKNGQG